MLDRTKLENILFLDIETVPEHENFEDLSKVKQELYEHKTAYKRGDEISAAEYYKSAGIWAEFGKIVCISVGYFVITSAERNFRIKTFQGEEKKILNSFKQLLQQYYSKPEYLLCAHNGKEFDFPYIARRMLIHKIALPEKLNLFGKKPWEIPYLDTLELWKFGDYKHYTSLKLLTDILDIPSPKEDIDGSQVAKVFYEDDDIDRIASYCERDTVAIAQIILRFKNMELLTEEEILKV